MIKLAAFIGENQHIGERRRANSGYISVRIFCFETEENTIRSIGTHVISLCIFLGISDGFGRWVNFERVQRAVIRDVSRVIRRQSGDSWHNAREFIPVQEDPIKCRFVSMKKKRMIEMLEMTDSSSIWFDIAGL